ncbi:DNA-binding XRE family transcriptional regulator [Caldalkalibacillus uzonensis]|uniref:DNA-binding XRE family transcriptional regulator n=1 Tax=Caldalkalibacillus uzonensis TaxID=353224 RepID=A0ABU0CX78_9BACI|nr:DNA-binding XRE family transcriptional regulator [Caldalkalibacillus uzonensis]
MAELTGLTPQNIRNIEKDVYECKTGLKVATAKKLAKPLDKSIWYVGYYDKLTEKTLGQKLKKARLYHGHTLEEAAEYLGVDEKTIRNWEKDIQLLRTDMLKRLKKYLEILLTEY